MNKVIVKPGGWLEQEIEVDAKITLCAMRGGMQAIMEWGFRNRDLFPTTHELTERVLALKNRYDLYIQAVAEKAAEMEKQYASIIP